MDKLLLIVDSKGVIQTVAESALSGIAVTVFTVPSVVSAKRKLVQNAPALILCMSNIEDDFEAGFKFCSEVRTHPTLSSIPVIIFSEKVTEDQISRARESKALGILPWPMDGDSMLAQLLTLVPSIAEIKAGREIGKGKTDAKPATVKANQENLNSSGDKSTTKVADQAADEKIKIAQQLLAKVLHSLKTSDLLQVIDLEDVPRVVYEMTRSVCGIKALDAPKVAKGEKKTEIDLERAFRIKHP